MPRRKPAPAANDFLRRSIASAAARLMAEDGIGDYGAAKRKAARSLGAGDGDALPSNEEVEVELRAYQSLYQEDEQQERLREMRETALRLMEAMADFRPCLTGSVLDGTAGRFSEIELDLFADSAKDVEIFLLSRNISYEISDNGQPTHHAAHLPEAQLRLDWEDFPAVLAIYPIAGERHAKRSARSGHGANGRARAAAVAALLASSP
jgi:hypothetical protein